MKRGADETCSTSFPTGNEVDRLPLVAMINMFLNVIASRSVLGNARFNSRCPFRLLIKIVRPQNDRAISEIYLVQVFLRGWYFDENFENFQNFRKHEELERNNQRKESEEKAGGRLLYELSERKPG